MRFIIKGPLKENVYSLMRQAGYHFQGKDEETEELSFVRPPQGYPRFHLFVKIEGEESKLSSSPTERAKASEGRKENEVFFDFAHARKNNDFIFNLHLDQKKPIYKGAPAHAGEYEGEIIEKEAERIKQIFQK